MKERGNEPAPPPDASGGDDPTKSMELAWQGQRGDARAVNELFVRYIPRMRRVLSIKIAAWQRSRIDPEDILQETLIVATRRLPELEVRSPASILQWLARIADYEIKNRQEYLRAEKRDPAREKRILSDPDGDPCSSGILVPFQGPTASQFLARNELEERMDAQLRELEPPEYRDVILMRDYYEADWESIRSQLGRPTIAAAQDLYHRAHQRLRERMVKYLE